MPRKTYTLEFKQQAVKLITLILPGLYMEDGRPPNISDLEFYDLSQSDGYSFIDNESLVIYSINSKKNIKLGEIKINEEKYLEEPLLIARSICGIELSYRGPENWIDGGDYNDMLYREENMEEIAEIVLGYYNKELKRAELEKNKKWGEDKFFDCSFIALWQDSYSQGYFDPYPELDDIEFLGEGDVVLRIKERK